MPFDDMNNDNGGGNGRDPHDDLEVIAQAMIEAAVGTAAVNGACISCAMEVMCKNVLAKHIQHWLEGYAEKTERTRPVPELVYERLKIMINEAIEIAGMEVSRDKKDD